MLAVSQLEDMKLYCHSRKKHLEGLQYDNHGFWEIGFSDSLCQWYEVITKWLSETPSMQGSVEVLFCGGVSSAVFWQNESQETFLPLPRLQDGALMCVKK